MYYYSGITNRQQKQVLDQFKQGGHKILIATSVAEEGLDIKACNIVFRYNYSTNEVGRVQTKGTICQSSQNHYYLCVYFIATIALI